MQGNKAKPVNAKTMKTNELKNASKFLSRNPFLLDSFVNSHGQTVDLYEHPVHGDSSPVYAVINNVLYLTTFFETDDMFTGSDYEPILTDNGILLNFEIR